MQNIEHITVLDTETHQKYIGTLTLRPYDWLIEYEANDTEGVYTFTWKSEDIIRRSAHPIMVFYNTKNTRLEVHTDNENLWDALKKHYPNDTFTLEERKKEKWGVATTLLRLALIFIVPLIIGYWLLAPWASEQLAMKLPKDYEIKLGSEMFENTLKGYEKDSILTQLGNDFVKNIDFKSEYPLEIAVVKDNQINAFAIPGGKIVIFDGILKKMDSYTELAALLGHEGAHVSERHSLRQLSRNVGGSVFLYLFLGNMEGLTGFFVNNLDNLKSLSYSRNLETEADTKGLETLDRNHITQQGMVKLFEKLKAASGGDGKYISFLLTHPLSEDRIQLAQSYVQKQQNAQEHLVLKDIFDKMKAHL
jgi:beta-barrel assembly-enhancing protease